MDTEQDNTSGVSRRELLSTMSFWGATLAAMGAVGFPAARFAVGKSLDTRTSHWVAIGPADKLPTEGFKRIVYEFRDKDAWRDVTTEGLIYARATAGGEVLVLSAVCTHLGCNVRWREDESRFVCPCHAGVYDADGKVVSGPPPKALRKIETRVKDGVIEALV